MATPKLLLPVLAVLILKPFAMSQEKTLPCPPTSSEIVAEFVSQSIHLDAAQPAKDWQRASPATFCGDWQGKNPDPQRETVVRALWTREMLFLRFECRYRALNLFPDSAPNGRRDHLWDRDVAEAFLQPNPSRERFYKEFEVAPNGMWIDLDIGPGLQEDLKSGMQRSVRIDEKQHRWAAELAIPMRALTARFDPNSPWRVNFFRVEGSAEPRNYYAWRPTYTPEPNYHVPSAFGTMRFAGSKSE